MLNQYNFVASYYSSLVKIIYGNGLLHIKQDLIKQLPSHGQLTILGGGNGEILPFIYTKSPNLNITYLEASNKMIALAQKAKPMKQKVNFIHTSKFDNVPKETNLVYAAFIFDLFSTDEAIQIIRKIEKQASTSLTWFVADFNLTQLKKHKYIRRLQIKLSIIFFKIVTKHSLNELPNVFDTFQQLQYNILKNNNLKGGFLVWKVFSRSTH